MKYGFWFVPLPPLLILGLAHLLFEATSGTAVTEFIRIMKTIGEHHSEITQTIIIDEARARYSWLATALLNLVVPLYAAYVGINTIRRSHTGNRLAMVLGFTLALGGLALASQIISLLTDGALYRLVFGFTYMTLQESRHFDAGFLNNVHTVVSIMNVLAAFVPAIILVAASSTLAPPSNNDQTDLCFLADHMRRLRSVLNATSALLVAGVLHMNAWLQWPASLMRDHALQTAVSGTALSITVFWGTTFTLMLIALYGPAATKLSLRARQLLNQEHQAGNIAEPQQWLREHDLAITFSEQLPQIGIMLAPVLAGPAGSFLMGSG